MVFFPGIEKSFSQYSTYVIKRTVPILLLLGYSPREVSKPYILLVVALNAAVLVLAIVLMLIGRLAYMDMIRAFGVGGSGVWIAILVGIIMGAITLGNIRAINKKINSLWLHEE